MKKVLGIGNALVDLMTQINNDSLLTELNLPKGSMQLVDKTLSQNIIEKTKNFPQTFTSGGSAANTIHGLAQLGVPAGFIGKIGKDNIGKIFKADMQRCNITTHLLESNTDSGIAVALVSPDSERTFAVHLGAAVELTAADLDSDFFKGYNYLHIEGYLLQNYELIEAACKLSKQNNLKISLDLASYNVVEAHLEFLQHIAKDYADIIFANEEEAKALTGLQPDEALLKISELCELAIVKTGKEGSLVKYNEEIHRISPHPAEPVDTTGAGDLYASGFIYGLIKGLPLGECGKLGSLLAKHVIEQVGAKIPQPIWKNIKTSLM